jgi:hypothetical protein
VSPELVYLTAQTFDRQAWSKFGWVPLPDTDDRDGDQQLEFTWGDVHVNFIRHTDDEIDTVNGAVVCDRLFRHLTHTQALLVLDQPCVIAVARADASFDTVDDLAQVAAFTLVPGDALVLDRGTWHWGPFPTSSSVVNLYNVQGRRYAEDNESIDLSHLGAALAVSSPAS